MKNKKLNHYFTVKKYSTFFIFLMLIISCNYITDNIKKVKYKINTFSNSLPTITGCEDAYDWFFWGTQINLPKNVQCINAFNPGANYLSNIYIKFRLNDSLISQLENKFTKVNNNPMYFLVDSLQNRDYELYLPNWNLEISNTSLIYLTNRTGSAEEGGFDSYMALDKKNKLLYCHLVEYSP